MGSFCGKCGNPIDGTTGLCPVCDAVPVEPEPVKKEFCGFCGNVIDSATGICGVCGSVKNQPIVEAAKPEKKGKPVKEKTIKEKAPKVKKPESAGRTVAVTLLAILLFFMSFFTILIGTVGTVAKEETIVDILDNIEFYDLIDSNYEINVAGDSLSLSEYFDYYFEDQGVHITEKKFSKFIDKSTFKQFVAEKIALFIEDIVTGDDEFEIGRREFENLIQDNSEVFEEVFDVTVSYELIEHFGEVLYDEETLGTLSADDLKDESPEIYYTIKYLLSPVTLIILIVICVLLIAGMILIKVTKGITATGVVAIIVGAIMTLLAIAGYIVSMLVDMDMITASLVSLLSGGLPLFIGILVFGILLLIGNIIVKSLLKRR